MISARGQQIGALLLRARRLPQDPRHGIRARRLGDFGVFQAVWRLSQCGDVLRDDVCVQNLDEIVGIFQITPHGHLPRSTAPQHGPFAPIKGICRERGEVVGIDGLVGVAEECRSLRSLAGVRNST